MKINAVKMRSNVSLPTYATDGSGCFDIVATGISDHGGGTITYNTGLKFEVPEGHVMLVYSRSGHGFNKDIRLANCVGVIDSDYRGELMVKLTQDGEDWSYARMPVHGDRIAQAMIVPIPKVEFVEVAEEDLSATHRGSGGFGSTN